MYITSNGIVVDEGTAQRQIEFQKKGWTAILVSFDKSVIAVIGIADNVKKNSSRVIQYLTNIGIESCMVTGDNKVTAHTIGAELGLARDHIHAGIDPEGKSRIVKELQRGGTW